jgi:hypothetical protein
MRPALVRNDRGGPILKYSTVSRCCSGRLSRLTRPLERVGLRWTLVVGWEGPRHVYLSPAQ